VRDPSGRTRCTAVSLVVGVLALLLLASGVPFAAASPYPTLPVGYDSEFLSNLSAPSLTPGSSGSLTFHVADPKPFAPMSEILLTFDVYAFNAFPGNASSTVATAGTPILVTATTSGTTANLSLAPLSPGDVDAGSVGVATADSTPNGAFAIRTALAFVANGTEYRLESRGWFSANEWAAATELPNGSATLNLTRLGVSGVTAETAILVTTSNWEWALALILGASLVLVGAGAFVYFRRTAKSSSGAR